MVMYDKKFKDEAVKMASEIGSVKTAQDLGVPVNTLYTWLSHAKIRGGRTNACSGNKRQSLESDEISKLNKRIKELEKACEILKEALGFFVVSQKK